MPDNSLIKCLVIDDEPRAREILRRYIKQVSTLTLVEECGNPIQAFTLLQQQPVDLLFLDIRMPQLNGNDFLKTLKHPPKVIFTTAFAEYALEGYELDVIDYLLKPIPFDRFLKAINKATQVSFPKIDITVPVEEKKPGSFVYFRADRKMVKVMLSDILYVESMKDYVKVFSNAGIIITRQSMSSVEALLPEKEFMRIHRSFIVSLNRIKSFTPELIEIEKTELPVGRLYRNEVLKVLTTE